MRVVPNEVYAVLSLAPLATLLENLADLGGPP